MLQLEISLLRVINFNSVDLKKKLQKPGFRFKDFKSDNFFFFFFFLKDFDLPDGTRNFLKDQKSAFGFAERSTLTTLTSDYKETLKRCFSRIFISKCGRGIELGSLTRNSSKGRAQVSNAIPTYLLKLLLNSMM